MQTRIPLLLTSSVIAHDNGVKLKETNARLRHTIEGIEKWLKIDASLQIVICDGSGYDLQSKLGHLPSKSTIEFLNFNNDKRLVAKFGRGYGEGEIVRHALENSILIKTAGCFAKCSSKLWVENFHDCLKVWNGYFLCKGVFSNVFSLFRETTFDYIDTRFYVASKLFYERHLLEAHKNIDASAGHSLEECFHDVIVKERIGQSLLPIAPIIHGVGGGTGKYYKNPIKRMLKEKLRVFFVRNNMQYAWLFANKN